MKFPIPARGLDHRTVGELFQQMKSAGQTVWFIDVGEWGGAAIFMRKPANDPALAEISTFNCQGHKPRTWRLPRRRFYPAELRQACVEHWAAEQKTLSPPAEKTIQAGQRQ